MGTATGFLDYTRAENTEIPVSERICNFKEFHKPLNSAARREQAARCMNCGVPFCQSAMRLGGMVTGCPLHNLIPEWNDMLSKGHEEHAMDRLGKTSNFPEFTGRVCPALCEKACINGEHSDPTTVHENELYLIETAFENGYIKPRVPKARSGKKVAVVGSGPSGLSTADMLNQRGHSVTVLERADRIGGLLMYGIPNMKLEKKVIERRRALMEQEGVTFKTGVNVGVDVTFEQLKQQYDAVVLCCGAKAARGLAGFDPEKIPGVYYAVDFLTSTTKALLDKKLADADTETILKAGGFLSAKGKHVVVVGGGDTGNDCIGTVIRHGCKSVTALEMMSAPPAERDQEKNPWPEWPKVLKVDYGHKEAIELFGADPRVYETTVKEAILDKKGHLKEIVTVKVAFEGRQMKFVEGSEKKIPCDLLLIAAGFVGCEKYVPEHFGLDLSPRGTIATSEGHYRTNVDGIFTAGDMHRGQSLVVWAIAEGRECAKEVDEYLMGYSNL